MADKLCNIVEGSIDEGSIDEGSIDEGSIDEGSIDEGYIDEGSIVEGSIRDPWSSSVQNCYFIHGFINVRPLSICWCFPLSKQHSNWWKSRGDVPW